MRRYVLKTTKIYAKINNDKFNLKSESIFHNNEY